MKIFLLISTILLLSACGSVKVKQQADVVQQTVIHPSPPPQLSMRKVDWTVFNRAKLEKLLADYPDREIVLFALSAKGYENLSLNVGEIIRYVKEQKNIIIYYREILPEADKLIEEENTEE